MADSQSTKSPVPRSGIYMIRCRPTGKVYVGSAVNIKDRWSKHRMELGRGIHCNSRLQRTWNKYSADAFEWVILEHVERERLIEREQHYIDMFHARDREYGFNVCMAGSSLGMKHSEESRAKISAMQRGKVLSPEHKAKIGAAHRGMVRSPECRSNISAGQLGRVHPPEARAKMSVSQRGRVTSSETKAKLSEANRGKALSPKHRAKISEAKRGRVFSPEHRAKLCEAQRNASPEIKAMRKKHASRYLQSPEGRANASEARRANKKLKAKKHQLCFDF